MLLHELGERADASPELLVAKLGELAEDCCPADEVQQVVARLALALGIGEEQRHREKRRYVVAEIRAGLLAFLDGLSRTAPVILVVEDAHQAQPPMLELIEQVVREAKRIPLLVLCVARYELLDERPEWGGGLGDSLNLYLESMTLDDATQLAQEAGEHLDPATAERIARHAGGNPFFIVETTGMLRHTDARLSPDTDSLPEQLLPPTVQAVIAARIDHLVQPAKDLVRVASIFALATFDESDLALLTDPDPKALDILEQEELLVRDAERPSVWRFRHGLVRDVAYDSLPKRERQRLHLLFADRILEDPKAAARYPRVIASHLERAARASLDLSPEDREVAERAVEALARAGDLALDASDTRAAAELYGRALALCGPERGWGVREAAMLSHRGEALYWQGEFDAAAAALTRALELAPDDVAIRAQASRFLGDIELSIRGDRDRATELLDRALAAARELDDPWTLARTLLVAGWGPYWREDLEGARAMFEEALEVAASNPEGDPWAETRALISLAGVVSETGDEAECLALASQGLAIAEGTRDRFSIATARDQVAAALRRTGRFEEGLGHADAAVENLRELGARWELASALTSRGVLFRHAGRLDDAVRDLREAYRLCRELKTQSMLTWTAGSLAKALAESGEVDRARQVLVETAPVVAVDGRPPPQDWLLGAEAEILLADGDREGALATSLELLELARASGWAKDVAAQTWWIAQVFGEDAAGGAEEVEPARKLLEGLHAVQSLREPELAPGR
jgi:tetratricopeptide (TPR) repeat protein